MLNNECIICGKDSKTAKIIFENQNGSRDRVLFCCESCQKKLIRDILSGDQNE